MYTTTSGDGKGFRPQSARFEPVVNRPETLNSNHSGAYVLSVAEDATVRPLKGDAIVVVSIVSPKVPELEPISFPKIRAEDAAHFAPAANLAISSQCAFLRSMIEMRLTINDEKEVLERIVRVNRDARRH